MALDKPERLARVNAMALTLGAYAMSRLHEIQKEEPKGDEMYWHAMASTYLSGLAEACSACVAYGNGEEGVTERIIDKFESIRRGEVVADAEGTSAE